MHVNFRSQLFINGEHAPAASGKTFTVLNPANNEVLTELAEAGTEDVNRAVAAAGLAFDEGPWPKMKTAERAKMIRRFVELLVKHAPELERIGSLDECVSVKKRVLDQFLPCPHRLNCSHYSKLGKLPKQWKSNVV